MQEDYDVRSVVETEASDIMLKAGRDLDPGSDEHSRAYASAKALYDVGAKYEEIEFKEKELEFKQKQLDQELQIHKDNQKSNLVRSIIEGAKVGVGAVAIWAGYKLNFKENGIEIGQTFKDLKRNFTNVFR